MAGSFSLDLARFARKVEGRMDLVVRKVCLDVFSRVVLKTPVDTGRARGNWMTGIGGYVTDSPYQGGKRRKSKADRSKPHRTNYGASTQASMVRIEATAVAARAGQVVYLTNSVPYILRLEEGSSTQAPAGMLTTTLREYPGIVENAASEAGRS